MKTEILSVYFDNVTLEEAVQAGLSLIEEEGCRFVVTPNAEMVYLSRKDAGFRQVLNQADLALPDGIGVVYAARILKRPLKGKVAGIDFATRLLPELARLDKPLFLLGAKPGVAEQAAARLQKDVPGLTICGMHHGYFQDDGPVIQTILDSGAQVVFVCLGAPRQERWMQKHGTLTGAQLLVGLGGCLDIFAGSVKRAPDLWIKLGLEWLYRLIREPRRIGRVCRLPLFCLHAAAARFRQGRT